MLRGGFNGAEKNVSGADLREPGTKAHLDMDNRHACSTGMVEDACGTNQEGIFIVFCVDRNDAGLAIHAQYRGTRWIDLKCCWHIDLLAVRKIWSSSTF
jgi:hypothetical protein